MARGGEGAGLTSAPRGAGPASHRPGGVEGEPAPPHGAPPSPARVYGGKTLIGPHDSHGRGCLRHQGHVPVQADLCAESGRCTPGHRRGRRLPAAGLPLVFRRLALQGLAAGGGRLRMAAHPAGSLPPAPVPLLLLCISHLSVSSLSPGLAEQQLENLLQVSQSDQSQFCSCH